MNDGRKRCATKDPEASRDVQALRDGEALHDEEDLHDDVEASHDGEALHEGEALPAGRTSKRRAVFIDRDGTISEEVGYVNHPSRYRVYPYAAEAVALLNRAGWLAVLVTNQAGVARGYFAEEMISAVHDVLRRELERGGARLDAIYYCPHHPSVGRAPYRADCDCRKPKPGLIERAAREFEIDLSVSWMIGDRYGDTELARNAGLRAAFVLSGYGRGEWEYQRAAWRHQPDMVAEDLLDAVRRIVGQGDADGA